MKSIVVVLLIGVVLGLVVGASSATIRLRHLTPIGGGKVEVDSDAYDFGELDASQEGSHEFVVTNKGTGPLTLSRGHSSCRCTVGEITKSKLSPGESTTVRVTWKSKNVGGTFKQTVRINTNDPDRRELVLSINGTFSEVVRVEPDELDFGHLVGNEPAIREAHILCNLPSRPLEIAGYDFTNVDLERFFDVKTRPMTADELIKEKHIGSGIVVTVTAKPGLPPGRFQQRILLRTNLPHPRDEVELDLAGSMGKEISVVGNGWDDDIGVLNIGAIKAGTRAERQVFLLARGADATKIRYNVVHVKPEFLNVKLGETDVVDEGKLSRTKLTIEIPPQDVPASYMDDSHGKAGEIDIDTTSSEVHQLKMRVRFAVEGNAPNARN